MVSICSSTKASLASSGSCLISIARTMMTLFLLCNRLAWNAEETAFARTSQQRRILNLGGGFIGAPHRWHGCFWYAVYWVWEVSAAWFYCVAVGEWDKEEWLSFIIKIIRKSSWLYLQIIAYRSKFLVWPIFKCYSYHNSPIYGFISVARNSCSSLVLPKY